MMGARITPYIDAGLFRARQQHAIEVRTEYLVAERGSILAERFDAALARCPPHGVAARPQKTGALDRGREANLLEQLVRARWNRFGEAARCIGLSLIHISEPT